MRDKYNDLNVDLTNLRPEPLPWLADVRETELGQLARNLSAALSAAGEAAARALVDLSRNLDTFKRTYVTSYEGRQLRRALRALGLLAPSPAPVPRYKRGRLRSRRERRDIRKAR